MERYKQKHRRKRRTQISSLLFAFILLVTTVNWPAINVKAAEDIVLTQKEVTTGSGNIDLKYNVPSGYASLWEVLQAGYTVLSVTYEVSGYSGKDAGIQGYVSHGESYSYETGGWKNLSDAPLGSLEFDFSAITYKDTMQHFGVQIANLDQTENVSYTITEVKLVYTGNVPGGDPVNPGGGGQGGGSFDGGNIGSIDPSQDYNFAKLLQLSLYFYDANMCGDEVSEKSLYSKEVYGGWRSNCHTEDAFTYDGVTYKVTGGYHDAGDHVKFGLPMTASFILLGAGYDNFKEAYQQLGQTAHFKTITDYYCEYIRNCTVLDSDGNVKALCYQVGDGSADHAQWNAPEVENQGATNRSVTLVADASNPGTDIVAGTAAALAFNYLNFGSKDDLEYAEKLFAFAKAHDKKLAKESGGFYRSSRWSDKYCLAAALLYHITGEQLYLEEYNSNKSSLGEMIDQCASWDNSAQLAVFYAPVKESAYEAKIAAWFNETANGNSTQYYCASKWGSARYNCNVQLMMLIYDKQHQTDIYGKWARYQMSIILGNNDAGINLVCGYNEKSPLKPHHRAASGYSGWDGFNANAEQKYVLYGALVGGPENNSFSSYEDNVKNAVTNEVACDYNAGMTGAAAALYLLNKDSGEDGFKKQTLLDNFYHGENPGGKPSAAPSGKPSAVPSAAPGESEAPSAVPSAAPSGKPSAVPSAAPSGKPSAVPSEAPSGKPSAVPSAAPGESEAPSAVPSEAPSGKPSAVPSEAPSAVPSEAPSAAPDGEEAITDWGEIIPADRPTDGKVPEGIWVAPLLEKTIYTGKAVTLDLHVYHGNERLVEGKDYSTVYKNNKKVYEGSLQERKAPVVTIRGKGNYRGKTSLKFHIYASDGSLPAAAETSMETDKTRVLLPAEVSYEKGGVRPDVKVYVDNRLLRYGKDYTVKYSNYKDAGTAEVIICGRGSYHGEVRRAYTIRPKDIAQTVFIAADKTRTSQSNVKTSITIYDTNGKKLSSDKDYDKASIEMTYGIDTMLSDGSIKKSGEKVEETDKTVSDTVIQVLVQAKGTNYTGSLLGSYRIASRNLSAARIQIDAPEYSRKEQTVTADRIHVSVKGRELTYGVDYVVESQDYMNAVKKGTASLVVTGKGQYEGCRKRVVFKIRAAGLDNMKGWQNN